MTYQNNRIPLKKVNVVSQILNYIDYTKPAMAVNNPHERLTQCHEIEHLYLCWN